MASDDLPTHASGNDQIDPQPGDNTTLTSVLDGYDREGFTTQFEIEAAAGAAGQPMLRCGNCANLVAPGDVAMHSGRRMEGASDPDDMLTVAAVTCPRCGADGVLVLHFGPTATAEESDVFHALRDARRDHVMPPSSSPGETVGDSCET